jgi:hypothetical protein
VAGEWKVDMPPKTIVMYFSCKLFTVSLFLLCFLCAGAQRHTEHYTITLPEQKVANSLYNSFRFIDARKDTSNMGIVQLGAFNRKARVMPARPLDTQFLAVFNQLIDSSAREGELLFLLRQLSFAEVTKATSEKGYCYLRAAVFGKTPEGYWPISKIDTVILIRSFDVTRAMFRNGSKTLHEFIGQNLVQSPAGNTPLFSLSNIIALDSIEKRSLPVYNTNVYTEGVYKSFAAFTQQQPDITNAEIAVDKTSLPRTVRVMNEQGKKEKVKSKELYALVYQGKPYIATEFGYYPLEKRTDDFYFTGKAKVNANTGDVMMASVFFGIIGGLLASSPVEAVFEMKVDHVSGGFIRLKEVPQPQQ